MNSKTISIFIPVLFAFFIVPICARAQFPASADHAPSSAIPMLFVNPVPSPSDFADDTLPPKPVWNNIYAEALGTGLVYTLNYERLLSQSFGLRVGFGYLPVSAEKKSGATVSESATSAPLTLSWFPFGASSSKLEIGAGFILY